MLRFEGERRIGSPTSVVWAKLRDASFLIGCIPDATATGTPSPDRASCTVRPGFAFVRGTLDLTIEVIHAEEPKNLRFLQLSKGIASSSEVEVSVNLAEAETATLIRWSAEVKRLGGLLKAIPTGLIRGAANKVIDDVWREIENKLTVVSGKA
jgi:carbon monoxide dehydrogenase subunit G